MSTPPCSSFQDPQPIYCHVEGFITPRKMLDIIQRVRAERNHCGTLEGRDFVMTVDSNGGHGPAALMVADNLFSKLSEMGVHVSTAVVGKCASAATILAGGGDIGRRYIHPFSHMGIHGSVGTSWLGGKIAGSLDNMMKNEPDYESLANRTTNLMATLVDFYTRHSPRGEFFWKSLTSSFSIKKFRAATSVSILGLSDHIGVPGDIMDLAIENKKKYVIKDMQQDAYFAAVRCKDALFGR
jgi:hypothetical protein